MNRAVPIPVDMLTEIQPNTKTEPWKEAESMKAFCQDVFTDIETDFNTPGWFEGRSVLAPTNKEVDSINDMMQDWLPGAGVKLSSADTLENPSDAFRFNTVQIRQVQEEVGQTAGQV
jgi:hypothetical protein